MSAAGDLAFLDQVLAAQSEARALVTSTPDGRPLADAPDWLVDRLVEVVGTGPFERCPHLTSPQVAFGGTWAPGRIVCVDCLDVEVDAIDAVELCDLCDPPAPRIGTLVSRSFALVIIVAVCEGCAVVLGGGDLS